MTGTGVRGTVGRSLLATLAAGAAALSTSAAAAEEAAAVCAFSAWSTDPDPAGLNVRAGPGSGFAVIGRLPPPRTSDGIAFYTEVEVTGSKDGWFRIDRATTDVYEPDAEPVVAFRGIGWVSGRFLGLSVEGRRLRAGPFEHAPVVVELEADASGEPLQVERLLSCRANWVEVEGRHRDRHVRGWTEDVCSNQVTTCP